MPVSALLSRISCPIHTALDAGYALEIAAHNTAIVHQPEIAVGAESTADVVAAVQFAREHGHHVTVHSTGHGAYEAIVGGVCISTARLNQVSIDPETHISTIGAGVRWDAVIAAAAELGLAPVSGASANVGVVGYLLGGGLGPLARSHGFSSDYIISFTVVTGEGEVVEASAAQNADLYWALRGGKGGLGIVTEVRLRLLELSTLYAGSLFFEEKDIEIGLRTWADWTATAHPQVSTSAAIIHFPPFDFIPEPLRGRRVLNLRFAYTGALEEGERLAAPLRAAAPVYLDLLGELPAAEIARIHNDPDKPSPDWVTGMLLTHIDQDFASTLLSHFGQGTDLPFVMAEVRHIGEVTWRDVDGGTAVGGRDAHFTFTLIGAPVPELFEAVLPAAADHITGTLSPWISGETNVNFMGKPRSAEHFASAWPAASFEKLAEVRHKYDPDGIFTYGYSGLRI